MPSALRKPSPVPAYNMLELVGSMTMEVTARFAIQSVVVFQVVPLFVVFHTPPPTLPSQTVLVVAGWTTIERILPPIFPGPNQVHIDGLIPPLVGCGPW